MHKTMRVAAVLAAFTMMSVSAFAQGGGAGVGHADCDGATIVEETDAGTRCTVKGHKKVTPMR